MAWFVGTCCVICLDNCEQNSVTVHQWPCAYAALMLTMYDPSLTACFCSFGSEQTDNCTCHQLYSRAGLQPVWRQLPDNLEVDAIL